MKQFNLKEAQQGAPLVTLGGYEAQYIGYAPKAGAGSKVVVWIENFGIAAVSETGVHQQNPKSHLTIFMAQKMVKLGDFEFPEPQREELRQGEEYFVVSLFDEHPVQVFNWFGDDDDLLRLQRGLVHLSQEDALAHYEALMKINRLKA